MKKIISCLFLAIFISFVAIVTLSASTPAQAGGIPLVVKGSGPTLYWEGLDQKRYVFPTSKTYLSWYSDFSQVITFSDDVLSTIPLGGNVTYRPGTRLVKITTDPKVYAVSRYGTLRWVTSESLAASLYGQHWAQLVDDIPDVFFVNYTIGAPIATQNVFNPNAEAQAVSNPGENIPRRLTAPPAAPPSSEELRARGFVRVINSSSQSQKLIRTTRLMTPAAKVYRLDQTIIIPAYGTITVEVYAEEQGSAYAISPTRFTIPGLELPMQSMIYAISDVAFTVRLPTSAATTPQIIYPTPNLLLMTFPRTLTIAWNGGSRRSRVQIEMGGQTISDRYYVMPYSYTTDNYQTSVQTDALAGDQWFRVHAQTLNEDNNYGPWSEFVYFYFQTSHS